MKFFLTFFQTEVITISMHFELLNHLFLKNTNQIIIFSFNFRLVMTVFHFSSLFWFFRTRSLLSKMILNFKSCYFFLKQHLLVMSNCMSNWTVFHLVSAIKCIDHRMSCWVISNYVLVVNQEKTLAEVIDLNWFSFILKTKKNIFVIELVQNLFCDPFFRWFRWTFDGTW